MQHEKGAKDDTATGDARRWRAAGAVRRVPGGLRGGAVGGAAPARRAAAGVQLCAGVREEGGVVPGGQAGARGDAAWQRTGEQTMEWWTAGQWGLAVAGKGVGGGVNPYQRIPYVVFPNVRAPGQFWGESDLVDLLGIQRDLNARFSVLSR